MEVFKNCSVIEFILLDEARNSIDVKYGIEVDKLKEFLNERNIDDKIITAEMDEVAGFKFTPETDDNTEMLFEISKDVYMLTFTAGKKKIPSGLIRKEVKKAIAEYEKERGGITSEEIFSITETVTLNIKSRAFMTYVDTFAVLDLSCGRNGMLFVASTSKSTVKSLAVNVFNNLGLKEGHMLEYNDHLQSVNDFIKMNILDSIIHERTHDLTDIVFTFNEGEDVIKLTSTSDIMSDDDLREQVKSNMVRFNCDLKTYSYFDRDAKTVVENKGVTSALHRAIGLKLKYQGESVNITEDDMADVYGELRSVLYHEVEVVKEVLKNMMNYQEM